MSAPTLEDQLYAAVDALVKGARDGAPVHVRVQLYERVAKIGRDVMLMGSFPQPPSSGNSRSQAVPPTDAYHEGEDPLHSWQA